MFYEPASAGHPALASTRAYPLDAAMPHRAMAALHCTARSLGGRIGDQHARPCAV